MCIVSWAGASRSLLNFLEGNVRHGIKTIALSLDISYLSMSFRNEGAWISSQADIAVHVMHDCLPIPLLLPRPTVWYPQITLHVATTLEKPQITYRNQPCILEQEKANKLLYAEKILPFPFFKISQLFPESPPPTLITGITLRHPS